MKRKNDNKDFVTYRTAEALRDAGYPQEEIKGWVGLLRQYAKGTRQEVAIYLPSGGKGCGFYLRQKPGLGNEAITAPHLWDAMKWLREEKKMCIEIIVWDNVNPYLIGVYRLTDPTFDLTDDHEDYSTYEEACDAAIATACRYINCKTKTS